MGAQQHTGTCEMETAPAVYAEIDRLRAINAELVEALESLLIGAWACGVPHPGERAVLQEAANIAIRAVAKAKGE